MNDRKKAAHEYVGSESVVAQRQFKHELCLTITLIKQFSDHFDCVNGNIVEEASPIRINTLKLESSQDGFLYIGVNLCL